MTIPGDVVKLPTQTLGLLALHTPWLADKLGGAAVAQIALASVEFGGSTSRPYIADLTRGDGVMFSPGTPGMWTDPFPSAQFVSLTGSLLTYPSAGTGPIAVAQGTGYGVLGSEFGGNSITAFQLNTPPYTPCPPLRKLGDVRPWPAQRYPISARL
jgi:hypothetical protein